MPDLKGRNFDYPMPQEGRMAKSHLYQIERDARALRQRLRDGDDLPGWVNVKIATSADRMSSVARYMGHKIDRAEGVAKHNPGSTVATDCGWVRLSRATRPQATLVARQLAKKLALDPGVRAVRVEPGQLGPPGTFDVVVYGKSQRFRIPRTVGIVNVVERWSPTHTARRNPVVTSGTVPVPGVPGVFMKPGVDLNDKMRGFAKELRKRLGFDLVITSGIRTPWAQAQALAQDHNFSVYGMGNQLVAELRANDAYPSAAEMAEILQRQVNRGAYLSRHMRGDALDFRVSGLTSEERSALLSTAREMVGQRNAIDEGDHIHVEELGTEWVKYLGLAMLVPVAVATVTTVAGLAGMWWFRRDIRRMLGR